MTDRTPSKRWMLLPVAALAGFIAIAVLVTFTPQRLAPIEAPILAWFQDIRAAGLDAVIIALTQLGDPAVVWPLSIAILFWLAYAARSRRTALLWGGTIAAAAVINTSVKWLIARYRPTDGVYDVGQDGVAAYSFPSGHATVNLALYGILAVLLARDLAPWMRRVVAMGLMILGFGIALSRVYLGAHWPSDVLASTLLAFAIVYWVDRTYIAGSRSEVDPRRFGAAVLISLIVFGGFNILRNHAADAARYTPGQVLEGQTSK